MAHGISLQQNDIWRQKPLRPPVTVATEQNVATVKCLVEKEPVPWIAWLWVIYWQIRNASCVSSSPSQFCPWELAWVMFLFTWRVGWAPFWLYLILLVLIFMDHSVECSVREAFGQCFVAEVNWSLHDYWVSVSLALCTKPRTNLTKGQGMQMPLASVDWPQNSS